MRPTALELHGFLSHVEPTLIDFADVDAAAILGVNGAGKTSIVEAIQWALYGRGRGRGPDDFVSFGQSECRVVFDFELEGQEYRVERQRQSGANGKSHLSLMTRGGEGLGFVPIGGDHLSETQAAIEELLGMSADTFEATSFIGQGRADAFTRLPPGKRKELLSEVLDLSRWEHLAARAKEHRVDLDTAVHVRTERMRDLEAALGQKHDANARLWELRTAKGDAEEEITRLEKLLEGTRNDLEHARATAAGVQAARQRLGELRDQRRRDEERLRQEHERATTEVRAIASALVKAEATLKRLRTAGEIAGKLAESADEKAARAEALQTQADEQMQKASETKERARDLEAKEKGARAALEEASERLEGLSHSAGSSCYTCGQDLSPRLRDELIRTLDQTTERLAAEVTEAGKLRGELNAEAAAFIETAGVLARQSREAALSGAEDSRAAERALTEAGRLTEEQARVTELEQRARQLTADAAGVALARGAAAEASEEEQQLEERLSEAQGLDAIVSEAQRTVEAQQNRLAEWREELTKRAAALGAAEERLKVLEEQETELAELKASMSEIQMFRDRHAMLESAFGRDGIPTLIVENAVPQIESEANGFLERLTEGRLSVRIDSLKAKKTGGLKETLDINVADGASERPLEALSGGERQAVDLALRHGIARLLAHRAGRRIETLILDESFTAFDAGGRQRALEVIHALQSEYRTVLFITHQIDMADAFPVQLQVSRENGSSHVEVVRA